ncbi:MAG: NAD(P)H-hydrate epimerase [Thaumarchaeota archaeon]|nr:NAD(P)H-hydrate epimerase [Nitrososphaerota archaeon]
MRSEGRFVYLTAEEMTEVDRMTIQDFGIDVLSLMENAGVATATLARKLLGGDVPGRRVCCLVGRGNNGGDGLVAARHLHNWGARTTVVLGGERNEMRDVPARQLAAVEKMGIKVSGPGGDFDGAALLIDALLGYGARGNPRDPLDGLIRRANESGADMLAVDIPSGLDATTGEPGEPCIVAKGTVTFGFPKEGFLNSVARKFMGELYLADISLPEAIYGMYFQRHGMFAKERLVKIG